MKQLVQNATSDKQMMQQGSRCREFFFSDSILRGRLFEEFVVASPQHSRLRELEALDSQNARVLEHIPILAFVLPPNPHTRIRFKACKAPNNQDKG